jgi:hypothetical protein
MYCPSCGVVVARGLSYCNHCGVKLTGAKADNPLESSEVKPGFLVFAMIAVFVFGLLAITMLMGMMRVVLELSAGQVLAFALLPLLIMLGLEGVFIRLLMRPRRGSEEANGAVRLAQKTNELDVSEARVLPEPAPSVTEHTTRSFEPIYNERILK